MKNIRIIFFAAVAALSFISCQKELKPSHAITIEAGIGSMSRATTAGNTTTFVTGDILSVYAWMGSKTAVSTPLVVNGVENTLGTDGKWIPARQMLWRDVTSAHYFLGIYPKRTVTNFTADPFTLNPADYEASDLLVATNLTGLKASDNPVTLNFDHTVAKLFVNLSFRDQWTTAPTVTAVTVKARKTGTVDYLTKTITASGTETAAPIALSKIDNAAWSGLQIPQSGVQTIIITIEGNDFVFTHSSDIPLVGGQYTTVNLNVGRNTIELASVGVSNWAAGTTIDDGDAQIVD